MASPSERHHDPAGRCAHFWHKGWSKAMPAISERAPRSAFFTYETTPSRRSSIREEPSDTNPNLAGTA